MRLVFFFNDTATTEIYTLSLHDALPISLIVVTALLITLLLRLAWRTAIRLLTAEQWRRRAWIIFGTGLGWCLLRSEEHTSELHPQANVLCRLLPEQKNLRVLVNRQPACD